jgi:hypothetical protein
MCAFDVPQRPDRGCQTRRQGGQVRRAPSAAPKPSTAPEASQRRLTGQPRDGASRAGAGAELEPRRKRHSGCERAAFEPFEEDLDAIVARHKALAQDIASLAESTSTEKEESLKRSVEALLRRIYAYLTWGVRQQADSDPAINQILQDLGFSIPIVEGRCLFDILVAPVGAVVLITAGFWLTYDAISGLQTSTSHSVLLALTSATAAMVMYGCAAFIALKQRGVQIEERVWREGSPKCLIPISVKAGLVTWGVIIWGVIIVSTAVWRQAETSQSLIALARWDNVPERKFLPGKILTALPWLLVGATASAVLASRMGGDVRRSDMSYRLYDAIVLGICLSLAFASAQLVQSALAEKLADIDKIALEYVPVVGLLGLLCGAVVGFMVPHACRANVVTPPDPIMARTLGELLDRAANVLGGEGAAKDWVFVPHTHLRGITPAEAIQYQGYADRVRASGRCVSHKGATEASSHRTRPKRGWR